MKIVVLDGAARIGALAKLAQTFGMRVIAHSRTPKEGIPCVDRCWPRRM